MQALENKSWALKNHEDGEGQVQLSKAIFSCNFFSKCVKKFKLVEYLGRLQFLKPSKFVEIFDSSVNILEDLNFIGVDKKLLCWFAKVF